MMVFKRKQIVVLSLILMIVIAGYLQYSYKKSSISVSETAESDSPRLGEAIYVDNMDAEADDKSKEKEDKDKKEDKKEDSKKTVQASKEANDFFAQAKMDKEITRGKNKDELKSIVEDPQSSKELKTQANDKMLSIIDSSEKEMAIETLIKEKGYNDVVVFMAGDGSLDVVVKTPGLSSVEATQIADIAARQANVPISSIHVRDIF